MMFDNITAVSHKLEDVFYFLREAHPDNVPHMELVEHVLEVEDFISGELEKIQNGDPVDGDSSEIVANLDEFLTAIKGGKKKKAKKPKSPEMFIKNRNNFILRLLRRTTAVFTRFLSRFLRKRKWQMFMRIRLCTH